MPMRVHVHAAIWVGDQLVIHREVTRGEAQLTLPGGRVHDRESTFDALHREVKEETGLTIEIDDLVAAGEVYGATAQSLVLVFAAQPAQGSDLRCLTLLDTDGPDAARVRPGLVETLVVRRGGGATGRTWVGNLYESGRPV